MSATVKHIRRVRSLMNGCLTQNQLPPVPLACSRGRPPQGPEGPGSEPGGHLTIPPHSESFCCSAGADA